MYLTLMKLNYIFNRIQRDQRSILVNSKEIQNELEVNLSLLKCYYIPDTIQGDQRLTLINLM